MKKTILSLGLMLVSALALTNCTKNEEVVTPQVSVPFELFAGIDTRTTNDGMSTEWATNDNISVFNAAAGTTTYSANNEFKTVAGDGNFTGTLKAALTEQAYDWYVIYPYSSYLKSPANTADGYSYIGSRSDGVQTQNGNNSMAHIAGKNYPLVGWAKDVPATEKPQITMQHVSSLIEFNVTNNTDDEFKVESIVFTAPVNINGTFYVNHSTTNVTFTDAQHISKSATLTVSNGAAIANGQSAKFYMAVKPFDADEDTLTINITTDKGTFEKSIDASTFFYAGKMKTINVKVDELEEEEEPTEEALPMPFTESFGTNQGAFTINNVNISTLTYVWKHDSSYKYMKASAYAGGTSHTTESWLVSPLIAVPAQTNGFPILTFDYAINHAKGTKALAVMVQANNGEWTEVEIPNYITVDSWNFESSGDIDLSAYKGKNIKFAFKYTSTTSAAATVEIKNIKFAVSKRSQTLSFETASYSLNIGDTFEGQPVNGAKTEVSWTSSNTDVATVDNTGRVTLGSTAGVTTITATAAESSEYLSASAKYTISVAEAGIETKTATLSFANTSNRLSTDANQQTWEQNGVRLVNNKGASSTDVSNYSNPVRLYKDSNITISTTLGAITAIEFTCSGESKYYLSGSYSGVTLSTNGNKVTALLTNYAESITFSKLANQVRLSSLTITYIANGSDVVIKNNQGLSFTQNVYNTILGQAFNAPTVSGAKTDVTYSSSNTSVATVNETTGAVEILAVGTTVITATAEESDEYNSATASYTINVMEPSTEVYKLITSGTLAVGDKIVIAAKDSNVAMSTEQKDNNRGQATIVKNSDNTITFGSNVQVFTVEAGTASGTFAFKTNAGYIYAASSSSNHLKTKSEKDANGSWTVSIAADGTASIKANGTNTRNVMQHNQTSSLFACYGSASQKAVVIYRAE